MSRNLHKYEELTPFEFEEEKKRASIIYLASGPLEFHEECNALGIDAFKGYDWCLASAEKTGGIVFPAIPIGPQRNHPRFEGDVSFMERDTIRSVASGERKERGCFGAPSLMSSLTLCKTLFGELLECFAQDLKFKLCVFVGTHGPSGDLCRQIVKECNGNVHGMEVMAVGTLQYNIDFIQKYYKDNGIKRISHGGLWETAFNYAMNPEFVQLQYLDGSKYPQTFGEISEEFFEGCIRPVKSEYKFLSEKFASELRDITIERLAADVKKRYDAIINL